MSETEHDVVVIGSGITGLTAARQLLRDGCGVATVEQGMFGGLVININELDGSIGGSGADLASDLMMEVGDLGVEPLAQAAVAVERLDDRWRIALADGGACVAGAVIVASGARLKRLDIPGEAEFEHRGVGQCADCDGPLYQGQDVVVIGGGDSALQEALVLARYCRQVHVIDREPALRARRHLVDAVLACENIVVRHASEPRAIHGSDGVESVRVESLTGEGATDIACSGLFAYIGLAPNSAFLPAFVARDAGGFVRTDASLCAAPGGLYAAGAVRSGYRGLLEHAIEEGTQAARQAMRDMVSW
ncbi:NAD(P)/FAD-dependent oxidoreductase [Bordetella sp. H567]|uniref:NAD(P)/FAD-dependent oxidoreductase n=1 Tax=Bordetella sp. H567 TaxID=1697043 RepID=UPI00082FE22B|nr:FAD-dependent oxidoreductase [Bordetella sp. H567]